MEPLEITEGLITTQQIANNLLQAFEVEYPED